MKLEVLLSGLNNPQPAVRVDVVRVLGMLDETRALEKLRERYTIETEPQVREAIAWAGKRLYQALQAGYSTTDELFRYFRIDREIETMPDIAEEDLMRQMQDQFDRDLMDMQRRAGRRQAGLAAAAGLGGAIAGSGVMGMRMMMDAMTPGAAKAGSNMGVGDTVVKRTPATAPSNADIDIWVKRLQTSSRPEQREQAIIELQQLNNPRALPNLAHAFLTDESPKVRQAAQRYGKILYWSTVYWDMEQSGALAEEMHRRAAALNKQIVVDTHSGKVRPDDVPAIPAGGGAPSPQTNAADDDEPDVDVSEILRKAQEARNKRKSKGRR